ncbi:MAG: hypothetical protein M1818_001701 [Claussenomyces sp. TS43310]|nr:MAG: hypothetical protein M1818_001701 [Claussenomyces sp. TS43310]
MSSSAKLSEATLSTLSKYTACDISDALLKLKVPGAGALPDLIPYCGGEVADSKTAGNVVIAPASTVYFIDKNDSGANHPPGNIPAGEHWVDLTKADSIVVESQPQGQHNAVLGGIMALRMKQRAARGVVVHGRIRDLEELRETGLPSQNKTKIWATATSTVGTGASTKAHAVEIPITIAGTTVTPGDYVFADPANGVVVIPQDKLTAVLDLLPRLTAADDRVKDDVARGMSVQEAFQKHRSSL